MQVLQHAGRIKLQVLLSWKSKVKSNNKFPFFHIHPFWSMIMIYLNRIVTV
jgi:hypothetical protein